MTNENNEIRVDMNNIEQLYSRVCRVKARVATLELPSSYSHNSQFSLAQKSVAQQNVSLEEMRELLKPFQRVRNFADTPATWRTILENVAQYEEELQCARLDGRVNSEQAQDFARKLQGYLQQVHHEMRQHSNFEQLAQADADLEALLNQYLNPAQGTNMTFAQFKLLSHAVRDLDRVVALVVACLDSQAEFVSGFELMTSYLELDKWSEFALAWNWDCDSCFGTLGQEVKSDSYVSANYKQNCLGTLIELVCEFLNSCTNRYLPIYLQQYSQTRESLLATCEYRPLVVTVTGTNGKGTTCNLLSHWASHIPHLLFTSPHILNYQERFKFVEYVDNSSEFSQGTQQRYASSLELCCAQLHLELVAYVINRLSLQLSKADSETLPFQVHIPTGEANVTSESNTEVSWLNLGYFGQAVMSLHYLLYRKQVPLLIQEVGIGGKLDQTNLLDADVVILTNITLDHQNFLGNTRESILDNKVHIARRGKSFYYADPQLDLLPNLQAYAAELGFVLHYLEPHNKLTNQQALVATAYQAWQEISDLLREHGYATGKQSVNSTQLPLLFGRRTCCHWLTTASLLHNEARHQLSRNALKLDCKQVHVDNFDWLQIAYHNQLVFDVAHNCGSMQELADYLAQTFLGYEPKPNFEIVVGMGAEKDLAGSLQAFATLPNCRIHITDFQRGTRGVSLEQTQANIQKLRVQLKQEVVYFELDSWLDLVLKPSSQPRVWVFCGSFYFIANLLERWDLYPQLLVDLQENAHSSCVYQ